MVGGRPCRLIYSMSLCLGVSLRMRAIKPVARLARCFCASRSVQETRPSIQAIAELRKALPGTSMLKAREALTASRSPDAPDTDNVEAAIAWLEQTRASDGAKREAKVASRVTAEGTIGLCTLSDGISSPGARAAMIELNCETDFVARNDIFGALARDIAHTAAWFPIVAASETPAVLSDVDVAAFLECPIIPFEASEENRHDVISVRAAITSVVARLGEKVALGRVASLAPTSGGSHGTALVCGSFAHGTASAPPAPLTPVAATFASGRVASLLAVQVHGSLSQRISSRTAATQHDDHDPDHDHDHDRNGDDERKRQLRALARSLARQAAGFPTTSIDAPTPTAAVASDASPETSGALLTQPFAMLLPAAGLDPSVNEQKSVRDALELWSNTYAGQADGIRVAALRRWEVGETAARPSDETSFADQVKEAAGLA